MMLSEFCLAGKLKVLLALIVSLLQDRLCSYHADEITWELGEGKMDLSFWFIENLLVKVSEIPLYSTGSESSINGGENLGLEW